MLDNYCFDPPLYARLPETGRRPVLDWSDPEIHRRDTWRRNWLTQATSHRHAQRDAAATRASRSVGDLRSAAELGGRPADAATRYPLLAHAEVAVQGANATLWRVDREQARAGQGFTELPRTPNAGSTAHVATATSTSTIPSSIWYPRLPSPGSAAYTRPFTPNPAAETSTMAHG